MIGRVKLLIAIEDEIYLDKVCDYLEAVDGRFQTERFSNAQALERWLSASPKCDICLYEAAFGAGEYLARCDGIKIVLGETNRFEMESGCYEIRLYQKLDDITSAILRVCSVDERFTGLEAGRSAQTRLHAFLSPSGGAGTSSVSLAAAMHLCLLGRRTLYINLEGVSSLSRLLPTGDGVTMTQIMRLVIERNTRLLTTVEGGKQTEQLSGVEYFSPFHDITDFDSLEPHHIKGLAEQIRGLGVYDEVVVDTSWNTKLNTPLLEEAHNAVLVARNTDSSVEKVNAYLRQVFEREASYRHRVKVVVNCAGGTLNGNLQIQPLAAIPRHSLLVDCANFAEIATGSNAFGKGVQQLALQL